MCRWLCPTWHLCLGFIKKNCEGNWTGKLTFGWRVFWCDFSHVFFHRTKRNRETVLEPHFCLKTRKILSVVAVSWLCIFWGCLEIFSNFVFVFFLGGMSRDIVMCCCFLQGSGWEEKVDFNVEKVDGFYWVKGHQGASFFQTLVEKSEGQKSCQFSQVKWVFGFPFWDGMIRYFFPKKGGMFWCFGNGFGGLFIGAHIHEEIWGNGKYMGSYPYCTDLRMNRMKHLAVATPSKYDYLNHDKSLCHLFCAL